MGVRLTIFALEIILEKRSSRRDQVQGRLDRLRERN